MPDLLLTQWARLKTSPIGYRLAQGAFWSFGGALISRALALLSAIVIARVLGRAGFGEFATLQNTVGMFSAFAGFGLGLTATKHVAQLRQTDPEKAGRIMALSELFACVTGLAAGLILWGFADEVATRILAAPHLRNPLRIGSGLLLLGALTTAQTGALSGFEAFRTIARINLWTGVAAFPLAIAGVLLWGLPGVVGGLVGAMGVNTWLNHFALRREAAAVGVPFRFAGCGRHWRVLWSYSLPAVMWGLLVAPANWYCNVLLVNQPGGYEEMGVFNAANQWRTLILFLPSTVATIVLPVLAHLEGKKDRHRQKKVLYYNVLFVGGFTLFTALGVTLFAPLIMSGYGQEYVAGAKALILLVFSAVLSATIGVIGQSIASSGQMWWGAGLNLIWALALVISAALLIRWGAVGLALANLIAYGIHLLTVSGYTYCVILRPDRSKPAQRG